MPFCFDWLLQHSRATAGSTSTSEHAVPRPPDSSASKVLGLARLLPTHQTHLPPKTTFITTTSTSTTTVEGSNTKEQKRREASPASKLHLKTVMDLNSGAQAAELSWHTRLDQQPARLAVKLSNRHKARVTFDAQVALRSPMSLKLAGSPQGIQSAALLIRPLRAGSSPAPLADASPPPVTSNHKAPAHPHNSSSSRLGAAGSSNLRQQLSPDNSNIPVRAAASQTPNSAPRVDRSGVPPTHTSSTAASSSSSTAPSRQGSRRQRQRQQQPGIDRQTHTADSLLLSTTAPLQSEQPAAISQGVCNPPISQPGGLQETSSSMTAPLAVDLQDTSPCQPLRRFSVQPEVSTGARGSSGGAAAGLSQLHWEVGWNWKAGGPVAAVSRQLDPTSSSSSAGAGLLAVQQFKAAYDAKAHSYTLTAGGASWNVTVAVPTHAKGFAGLVPRLWKDGCRPKITVSLVPELTCF